MSVGARPDACLTRRTGRLMRQTCETETNLSDTRPRAAAPSLPLSGGPSASVASARRQCADLQPDRLSVAANSVPRNAQTKKEPQWSPNLQVKR